MNPSNRDSHDKSFKGYTIPHKGKYSFGRITLELEMRPYTQNELMEMAYRAGQSHKLDLPEFAEVWQDHVYKKFHGPNDNSVQFLYRGAAEAYDYIKSKLNPVAAREFTDDEIYDMAPADLDTTDEDPEGCDCRGGFVDGFRHCLALMKGETE